MKDQTASPVKFIVSCPDVVIRLVTLVNAYDVARYTMNAGKAISAALGCDIAALDGKTPQEVCAAAQEALRRIRERPEFARKDMQPTGGWGSVKGVTLFFNQVVAGCHVSGGRVYVNFE